jgi:hypothetical protein
MILDVQKTGTAESKDALSENLKCLSFFQDLNTETKFRCCGQKGERGVMVAGTFKQEILKVYNRVNRQIFNTGVRQQNVEFAGNKIIILSLNARIPALKL